MKLDGWSIDGCGHLRDTGISGLAPGVSVILGPNESGKTTTLQFLRWVLFGFPNANNARVRQLRPTDAPLGGRVSLQHQGTSLVTERHLGDTSPTLTLANGAAAPNITWQEVVGSAQLELFENVFAITTDELQELGHLSGDAVRQHIYAASTVGGGVSAREVLQELNRRRSSLLAPRSGPIRERARELKAAQAELAAARGEAAAIGAARTNVAELAEAVEVAYEEHQSCLAEVARIDHLVEIWPEWVDARDATATLDGLPEARPLPGNAAVILRTAQDRVEHAVTSLDTAEVAVAAKQNAINAIKVDTSAIAVAAEVRRCSELRAATEQSRQQRDTKEATARRLEDRIQHHLADIGHGITPSSVSSISADAQAIRTTRAAVDTLATANNDRSDAERELAHADSSLTEATTDLQAATQQQSLLLGQLPASIDPIPALEASHQLQTLIPNIAERNARAAAVPPPIPTPPQRASTPLQPALWLIAALALAGAAAGALLSEFVVTVALVVLGAAVAGVALLARRAGDPAESPAASDAAPPSAATPSTATAPDLDQQFEVAVDRAGFTERPGIQLVTDRVRQLEAIRALDADILRLRQRYEGVAGEHRSATERVEAAAAAVEHARSEFDQLRSSLGIPADVSAPDAVEFLQAVAQAQRDLEQLGELRSDADVLERQIDEFDTAVAAVLRAARDHPADAVAHPDAALAQLAADVEAAENAIQRQDVLTGDLSELQAAVKAAEAQLANARDGLSALLQEAGVDSVADFEAAIDQHDQRAALTTAVTSFGQQLAYRFGNDDAVAAARLELASGDVEAWRSRGAELVVAVETSRNVHDDAVRAHQDAAKALEMLESSADVPQLSLVVSQLRSELEDLVDQWVVASVAHRSIDDTLRLFERERQPAVVQHAQESFTRITGGRYTGIVPDEKSIDVLRPNGSRLAAEDLSRGTTEQLYLAMRFGLARQYANSTALPLILDDVLVNADAERQHALADELGEVATDLQVIVFTCHARTAEMLAASKAAATVLEMPC